MTLLQIASSPRDIFPCIFNQQIKVIHWCYSLIMKVEISKRLIKIKYRNVFFYICSFIYYIFNQQNNVIKNDDRNSKKICIIDTCFDIINQYEICLSVLIIFECAKRTKFLLDVIYGSPRRHSSALKLLKKIWKKIEKNSYDHFRTSWII